MQIGETRKLAPHLKKYTEGFVKFMKYANILRNTHKRESMD